MTKALSILSLGLLSISSAQALINYSIVSVETEIVGIDGSTVTSSGDGDNFQVGAAVNDFAVFNILGDNPEGPDFNAQLRVTYAADMGSIGDNIMIARTTDSQGLTDTGTFSVLMTVGSGGGGVRLQLDWFDAGTYTGATANVDPETARISPIINFTTFDIDYSQYVAVERSVISE